MIAVVCTNRPPAAVAPALDALRAQDARVLVVASGGAAPDAFGPDVAVLHEPRPGLSRARNRALAECADDEVLAFVDDDAIAGDGWRAAMEAAWDRAEAAVACIGGPIRPCFEAERPAWLSDRLLPVLTTLDYGPEPRDLDPFATTVYGANVAFRAGPLRDVGGFEPGLGHGGRPTGFGEEDEAERALARARLPGALRARALGRARHPGRADAAGGLPAPPLRVRRRPRRARRPGAGAGGAPARHLGRRCARRGGAPRQRPDHGTRHASGRERRRPARARARPPMILLLHNRYRITGGEERAVEDYAWLIREHLGEEAEVLERDSAALSRSRAAAAMLRGGLRPEDVAAAVRRTGARIVHAHNLNPSFGWRALARRALGRRGIVLHLHNYRLVCAVGTCFTHGADCTRCHGRNTLPGVRLACRGDRGEAAVYGAGLALWQRRLAGAVDRFVVPSEAALQRLQLLGAPLDARAPPSSPTRCASSPAARRPRAAPTRSWPRAWRRRRACTSPSTPPAAPGARSSWSATGRCGGRCASTRAAST